MIILSTLGMVLGAATIVAGVYWFITNIQFKENDVKSETEEKEKV